MLRGKEDLSSPCKPANSISGGKKRRRISALIRRLAALASLVAILWYGKEGVPALALTNYQRAAYLRQQLASIPGIQTDEKAPIFNEFVVRFQKPIEKVQVQFRTHGIEPGVALGRYFPSLASHLLVAVTETKNQDQLDRYAAMQKRLWEMTQTIFEKSQSKQRAYSLPKGEAFQAFQPPREYCRQTDLPLPEVSEIDLTRHFAGLAKRNMGIDTNFYPLGSCTMKLNPRINELCAQLPGFARTHPLAPDEMVQGNLQLIDELIRFLCEVCGMTAGTLLPNAGAQGEFTGVQMIGAYHRSQGDLNALNC